MRVSQQQQCYDAESVLGYGTTLRDAAAAQAWVDALRDEPWWHLQGFSLAVSRIEVGRARGQSVGWFEPKLDAGRIELGPGQCNTSTILHEVAHVLSMSMYDSTSHDPSWCMVYLTLVACVLGSDAYTKLKLSFDEHGVNYDATLKSAATFAL